jgi:nucleoside-diphosphate-sugar epimerase
MVVVAISGGGGSIGSNIVDAIHRTNKHTVVVLSRSQQPDLTSRGIEVRLVDYTSPEGLQAALRDVHTVISCLKVYSDEMASAQLALVEAAKQAGVKRFVPSDWAADCVEVDVYAMKEPIWKAVQASGMEYTRFIVGFWMNTWGVGAVRDENAALSGYASQPFILNLRDGTATFPADGSQQAVFTAMQDIGKFVAASLDLPKWEPDSRIVGDKVSGNELVKLVKEICGRELQVTRVPVEEISSTLDNPDLGFYHRFYYQLLEAIANRRIDFDPTLNAILPEIKPMSVAEYLKRFWSDGKEDI